EDFTVLENGAEQKIATFEEITSDPQRWSRPKNPNEFANSLSGESSNRRITLLVLDLINTSFMAQANAREELLKYLAQSVDQREPTALYTLTRNGIQVVHDFTSDPRILVAALHQVRGDTTHDTMIDPAGVNSEAQKIQSMMGDAETNFRSFERRLAITYTLDGLEQVAQALAGFPGRKSLIWAGGGFPFSVGDDMHLASIGGDTLSDLLPMYEHTWQLLNNAQIALYPVDVKGLVVPLASASVGNPGKNYGRNMNRRLMETQANSEIFASMTGGRAYYNSNDLVRGFRDAMHLAPDAALIDDADNNHVELDFVALVKTPDGKQVDQPRDQKIDTHLTPEKLSSIRQNGVGYKGFLDLAPGEYAVRFVVRDDLSGRIGSVAAPLKVE